MTIEQKSTTQWQEDAREFLQKQLNDRAPDDVDLAATFNESPLDGEGIVAILFFDLKPAANADPCHAVDLAHFVAIGETKPNYLPRYGLDADDSYSLHVGTRFFLEVGIERLDPGDEPEHFRNHMTQFVQGCNPNATVTDEECVLLLRCNDQQFAVYKMKIEQTEVYLVAGDLPPGFITPPAFPPQVALRLHLGRLIREEARREREKPKK